MSASAPRSWAAREGTPSPLGLPWAAGEHAYNFALYSKHAERVTLLLYTDDDVTKPVVTCPLPRRTNKSGRVWHCRTSKAAMRGARFHASSVAGPAPAGRFEHHAVDSQKVLLDPYAQAIFSPATVARHPLLPIQVRWINMVTVSVLGMVLAMEDKEADVMRRPPRDPDARSLGPELAGRIVLVGWRILAGAYGLFKCEQPSSAGLAEARTVAVNVVGFIEMFSLFNCRSFTLSMFQIGVVSNRWLVVGWGIMVALQLAFTCVPFLNVLMASAAIAPRRLGASAGAGRRWLRGGRDRQGAVATAGTRDAALIVLALNCGSASVKFQAIDAELDAPAGRQARRLARGSIERNGAGTLLRCELAGEPPIAEGAGVADHDSAIRQALDWMRASDVRPRVDAVGHRVVHGGESFTRPVVIDGQVAARTGALAELAPLHNAPGVAGIRACRRLLRPRMPMVAVFDTTCHATLPEHAYRYAIPYERSLRHRICRYGFHGTSYRSVLSRYRRATGTAPERATILGLHLGNGCSAIAIERGQSVGTSMGFTPLDDGRRS